VPYFTVILCTKIGDPIFTSFWFIARKERQTDGQTNGQTDGRSTLLTPFGPFQSVDMHG